MSAVQWTSRKVPRRRGVFEHNAVVHGLQVQVEEDRFGSRWNVRGYLGDIRIYAHDTRYELHRPVERARELGVAAAARMAAAGVCGEPPPRPVDPVDTIAAAFAAKPRSAS